METYKKQTNSNRSLASVVSSVAHTVNALVGSQQLLEDFSAAAAHYDGLIDAIERAGWDLSRLERVKHAFDETAEALLGELADSLPDMSGAEQRSFLAPFRRAIGQFAGMNVHERQAFRAEYSRFSELHAQSIAQLAVENAA